MHLPPDLNPLVCQTTLKVGNCLSSGLPKHNFNYSQAQFCPTGYAHPQYSPKLAISRRKQKNGAVAAVVRLTN